MFHILCFSVVRGCGGQPLRGRGCEVSFAVWMFWGYPRTPVPPHPRTSAPPYLRTPVPSHLRTPAPPYLRPPAPPHLRTSVPPKLSSYPRPRRGCPPGPRSSETLISRFETGVQVGGQKVDLQRVLAGGGGWHEPLVVAAALRARTVDAVVGGGVGIVSRGEEEQTVVA